MHDLNFILCNHQTIGINKMKPMGTVFFPLYLNAQKERRETKKCIRRWLDRKNNVRQLNFAQMAHEFIDCRTIENSNFEWLKFLPSVVYAFQNMQILNRKYIQI